MPVSEKKIQKIDSYGNVEIFEGFPYNFYELKAEPFSVQELEIAKALIGTINRHLSVSELKRQLKAEQELIEEFNSQIIQSIELSQLIDKFPSSIQWSELSKSLSSLLKKNFPSVKNSDDLAEYVLGNSIGFKKLHSLLSDSRLEEVMVNGFDRNVFVFHRKSGLCKTNIAIEKKMLENILGKIASTVGKKFNEENPLLDARLPDGSRANATFSNVSAFGHTLTVRKFSRTPMSIIEMIERKTVSSELAAFLWLMVEGLNIEPMNIIVTGGTGSGKTSFMNSLASFIRYSDRIISIEDTQETDLGGRENWIPLESRLKIGTGEEVSMNDLLKNALRMRPDRIIVGEVRGEEAQTLFTAMDTGHRGILGTLHSNTAKEMLTRLKSAPMHVPEPVIPLLNLSVVMVKMYDRERGVIRRIKEVAELASMEDKVLLSNIFEWGRKSDSIQQTDVPSHLLDVLAEHTDYSKKELKNEILVRQRILEWMLESGIKSSSEVDSTIQQYYLNPLSVIEKASKGL